jgi:hypothetical protein
MNTLLIHNNELTYRGDATNTQNVALMLKHEEINTVVVTPKSDRNHQGRISEMRASGIIVEEYKSEKDLISLSKSFNVSHSMFVHDGRYRNFWIPNTKHLVHAVFNNYEPHGDVYAYVSEWLYKHALKSKNSRTLVEIKDIKASSNNPYKVGESVNTTWVPHTVMPKIGDGAYFRVANKIARESFLIGRIGGYTEFNDPAAKSAVMSILEKNKNVVFLFVNTKPFILHSNVKYMGYISETQKWDFYQACDLLLNGRLMGESFGFSIVEPLMLGKPILGPDSIRNKNMDKHHIDILEPMHLLYKSKRDLEKKINKIMENQIESHKLKLLVEKFSVDKIRQRFINEFLI